MQALAAASAAASEVPADAAATEAESSILKGYDGRYDMADMVIST